MRKQGSIVLKTSVIIIRDSGPRKLIQMGSQKSVKSVSGPWVHLGTRALGPVCGGGRQGHEATVFMEKLPCPGGVLGSGTAGSLQPPAQFVCALRASGLACLPGLPTELD